MIVLPKPCVDDDLSLFNVREPLGVQYLSAQSSVEAFIVTILPWATGIDLDWRDADFLEPRLQIAGDELCAVLITKILRLSVFKEQWIKRL